MSHRMTSSSLIGQTLLICYPTSLEILAAGESKQICMESEKTTLLIFSLFSTYHRDDISIQVTTPNHNYIVSLCVAESLQFTRG